MLLTAPVPLAAWLDVFLPFSLAGAPVVAGDFVRRDLVPIGTCRSSGVGCGRWGIGVTDPGGRGRIGSAGRVRVRLGLGAGAGLGEAGDGSGTLRCFCLQQLRVYLERRAQWGFVRSMIERVFEAQVVGMRKLAEEPVNERREEVDDLALGRYLTNAKEGQEGVASSTARPTMGQTAEKTMLSGQVSGEIQCVRKTVTRGLTHPLPVLWCCDPPWNLGSSMRWGWLDRATGLKQGQRDTVAFRVIVFPVAILTLEMAGMEQKRARVCNSTS